MRITEYYGIEGEVPFLDVRIDRDNKLFIDPFVVRHAVAPSPHAESARTCLDTFFAEVTSCSLSEDDGRRRRGAQLLSSFKEPKETRLGLAQHGFDGHGAAVDIGDRIWGALNVSLAALVSVGLLRRVEQLPLFVEGVGNDVTSDLTTRLIMQPLLDFTAEMVGIFPEFASQGMVTSEMTVWSGGDLDWAVKPTKLPAPSGHPLVLVPAGWVSTALEVRGTRFYEKAILDFAQAENLSMDRRGKVVKVAKPKLMLDPRYDRATQNQIEIILRAFDQDVDLLERFDQFVSAKYDGPDQDRISRRIA
ncbi:hypothetical protein EDD41_2313 [Luteococcus japonicus]|uniref:Uncharacterized protein n=1 Tax=Luteococcus japonicus TaxID=33984 RepID=A0A3N1ZY58_9ACTN|nr:hypothetical protein [Luteococcus japonicus]ROR55062.1 hypothetical protein EDD41_2313 [Luteococcus japonicus]